MKKSSRQCRGIAFMKIRSITMCGLAAFLAVSSLSAQDVNPDRVTVSWSDPSRPGLLKVNFMNASITVKSYAGKDVIIESTSSNRGRPRPPRPDGLKRIDTNGDGFVVEEENNVMSVTARSFNNGGLEIQVPAKTNLNLRTVNGGAIVVEGIEGEIELSNTNGNVRLRDVAGSVVAHATNGSLVATLRDVTPGKPMSFTSMNANIDVTLPPATKANLKVRTDNGEAWSDFDFQLRPNAAPTVEDSRQRGGPFRIQIDKTINGTINGGGPDFDFRTLNGNIYIRKSK